ncbi:reverse transcriptase domain-containing protein, partial [Tanacetum coccineum]
RSRVAARSSPPSSPVYDSPPTLCQILPAPPGLPRRLAVLVLPGQQIPVGRPYPDYSSSDHFTSDDSSLDSPSDSSSATSLDSHSDTSSDSPSRHSLSGHFISDSPCDLPTIISTRPSRKRRRSPTTSVPVASLVPEALSPIRADLLPPCKRIRDSDSVTDFKVSLEEGFVPYVPREIGLGVDVKDSYEPYTEPDIDPDVQADIDACIAFTDDIAARGTDVRVQDRAVAEEEAESSARGTIEIGERRWRKGPREIGSEELQEEKVVQKGLDVVMQELYDHMTGNNEANARAYAIGGGRASLDSNVVTGLLGHPFNINLMHVELGSFDVIVGMDWLAKYHTVIVYDEKVVRIPYGDEVLIIEGGGCNGGRAENLAAHHLSRLENPDLGTFTEEEITDEFPEEHLMILKAELNSDEPWYADYVNYIVGKIVPPNWTLEKRRRFFAQVKNYFWDEPYAFKLCSDNVMRRCVARNEIHEILAHCHSGPTGGYHNASITGRKFGIVEQL